LNSSDHRLGIKADDNPRPGTFVIRRYHDYGDWRPVEDRLLSEAESLGDLLLDFKSFVSPALLDEPAWPSVIAATEQWPATCGALPFGFEFPLRDPRPGADFGITLVSPGKTADWIRRQARAGTAPTVIRRLAGLLDAMSTTLHREIDRAMLEIDIVTPGSRASREPGVFVYFRARPPGRSNDERHEVDAVFAAMNAAVGRPDDQNEFRLAERVSRAVPPGASLISVGALPGRDRGFRLSVNGFAEGGDAAAFLRRVGWNGRYDALAEAVVRLQRRRAFDRLGVMLYGCPEGLETRLGLHLLRRTPSEMPVLLDALAGEGCVEGKLSGLRATATTAVELWGRTGAFTLQRGISHVKLVLSDTGFEQAKAYVGFVCA